MSEFAFTYAMSGNFLPENLPANCNPNISTESKGLHEYNWLSFSGIFPPCSFGKTEYQNLAATSSPRNTFARKSKHECSY